MATQSSNGRTQAELPVCGESVNHNINYLPEGYELKESYPFTCISCGHEQHARPSIMMHMGINSGCGSCLQCDQFLHLEIDHMGDSMISKKWNDHLIERGITVQDT